MIDLPFDRLVEASLVFKDICGRPNYIAWLTQELERERIAVSRCYPLLPVGGTSAGASGQFSPFGPDAPTLQERVR